MCITYVLCSSSSNMFAFNVFYISQVRFYFPAKCVLETGIHIEFRGSSNIIFCSYKERKRWTFVLVGNALVFINGFFITPWLIVFTFIVSGEFQQTFLFQVCWFSMMVSSIHSFLAFFEGAQDDKIKWRQ